MNRIRMATITSAALLLLAASDAQAARSSKPREIVVVGSKLMEQQADGFVRFAEKLLNTSGPLIRRLRAASRDDLADEAVLRISERLRHKSRLAQAHVDRVAEWALQLLLLHNGTPADAAEVQAVREAALRRITEEEERIIGVLVGL